MPKPLTGLKHREPGTPRTLSGPHGPSTHANQVGAQPVFPERPVPGTCGSSHAFRDPTGVAVFLQKGKEARLGHQAQPSHGHPLVSSGAMGARGRSGTRHRGEGGTRSQSAGGWSRGEGGILHPTGDGDTETAVGTHTSRHVHTSAPTHALLGAQKPPNALRPPAMPSGQSAQLGRGMGLGALPDAEPRVLGPESPRNCSLLHRSWEGRPPPKASSCSSLSPEAC